MSKELLVDTQGTARATLTEGKEGQLIARGEFARCGVPTANKRIYAENLWKREIGKLKESIESKRAFGECDHPSDGKTKLQRVSHLITDLSIDDNGVIIGEAIILDTSKGKDLKAIADAGGQVGVSSRGYGSVQRNNEGYDVVQEDFNLLTFDFVADPANVTSYPKFEYAPAHKEKETSMLPDIAAESKAESESNLSEDIIKTALMAGSLLLSHPAQADPQAIEKRINDNLRGQESELTAQVSHEPKGLKVVFMDKEQNKKHEHLYPYEKEQEAAKTEEVNEGIIEESSTWYVIDFDKSSSPAMGIIRGVHSDKDTAQGQADKENAMIKNKSEKVEVIPHSEFVKLKKKGLLQAEKDSSMLGMEVQKESKVRETLNMLEKIEEENKSLKAEAVSLKEESDRLQKITKDMGFSLWMERNLKEHPKFQSIMECTDRTKFDTLEDLKKHCSIYLEDVKTFKQQTHLESVVKLDSLQQKCNQLEEQVQSLQEKNQELEEQCVEFSARAYLESRLQGNPFITEARSAFSNLPTKNKANVDFICESFVERVANNGCANGPNSGVFNQVREALSRRRVVSETLVEDCLEEAGMHKSRVTQNEELEFAPGVTQSIQEIRTLASGKSD